jgi:hypothetical protein
MNTNTCSDHESILAAKSAPVDRECDRDDGRVGKLHSADASWRKQEWRLLRRSWKPRCVRVYQHVCMEEDQMRQGLTVAEPDIYSQMF